MADDERVETESMPLTEPYKPAFDTGIHQKAEPELIEPEPPASAASMVAPTVGRRREAGSAGRRIHPAVVHRRTAVRVDSHVGDCGARPVPVREVVAVRPDAAGGLDSRRGDRRGPVLLVEPRRLQAQDRGGFRRPGLRRGEHGRGSDTGDGGRPATGVGAGHRDDLGGVRRPSSAPPRSTASSTANTASDIARRASCRTEHLHYGCARLAG